MHVVKMLCHYQCQKIRSFAALLILAWLAVIKIGVPDLFFFLPGVSDTPHHRLILYDGPLLLFYFLLPTVGLYADIRMGRLKSVIIAISSTLFATLLLLIAVLLSQALPGLHMTSRILVYIGLPLYTLTQRCFQIVALLFAIDQLTDAPSRELAAFFQWNYASKIYSRMVFNSSFELRISRTTPNAKKYTTFMSPPHSSAFHIVFIHTVPKVASCASSCNKPFLTDCQSPQLCQEEQVLQMPKCHDLF